MTEFAVQIELTSPVPPFEQIRAQLAGLITAGELPAGTRLPPVRQLAGDLGLAAGTVARAYRELDEAGLVQGQGRHGTIVRAGAPITADEQARQTALSTAAAHLADVAVRLGLDDDATVAATRAALARLRPRPV